MELLQKELTLPAYKRGFHLISEIIIHEFPEISRLNTGMLHILIKHTSAGITLNENADPSVRHDFESYFNKLVPENTSYFQHNDEGPDDMPAHIKASMTGSVLSIPVTKGRLNLGTWQGIYLCEFRNHAGPRHLVLTLIGA